MSSSALDCLFFPFSNGYLEWPDAASKAVFLCAEEHPAISNLTGQTVCQQHFKPAFDRLEAVGKSVSPEVDIEDGAAEYVFLLAPRQVQDMSYRIAQGIQKTRDGGLFVCAAANNAGGNRLAKLLKRLGLEPDSESKHKAKVVWATVERRLLDVDTLNEYLGFGELRRAAHGMLSYPGIFGWDKVDRGSAMLAECLPAELNGCGADFGCGYGYLSHELLSDNHDLERLYCIDADFRALEACRHNLQKYQDNTEIHFIWEDLAAPEPPVKDLDWIVMNPPFHSARQVSIELGLSCIRTASQALRKGGSLWMVANAHLPYENMLKAQFSVSECLKENDGFKVFHCRK